ncbi:hypothetical protein BpHYR1_007591 [Brachionus plicatilis]|uniref:Uncharacterized protein n=1 Tax=Brachionus plicatilis TaxID=10195 RepID=A0A3M7R175_BRAPC|nr:hypothetical protein BpHYR1_007591 [Brachionus plicatilis]
MGELELEAAFPTLAYMSYADESFVCCCWESCWGLPQSQPGSVAQRLGYLLVVELAHSIQIEPLNYH